MSIDTEVVGVRDIDGKFAKMLAVKMACDKAGVDYPEEVDDYFDGETGGSEDELRQKMEEIEIKCHESSEDGVNTWTVVLSELPPEVKAIRFKNIY